MVPDAPDALSQNVAGFVLAVANRQDDCVSLIALHPLEVLDEEPLGLVEREEALQVGMRLAYTRELGFDAIGVRDAHRNHSEALTGGECGRAR
jgi:hypothetical protein